LRIDWEIAAPSRIDTSVCPGAEVSVRINEVILGCRVTFTDDAAELSAEITPLIVEAQEKNGKTTRLAIIKRNKKITFRELLVLMAAAYILLNK
jgi:hypothetical protein